MPIDATAQLSLPFDQFFLARQPILGRDQRLVAFELLFRTAGSTEANVTDDAAATAAVISHASQLGMEHVVGAQLAFVNVSAESLMGDYVRFLPAEKVILEILETVRATPELVARVAELKALGFKFALDDVVAESDDVRALFKLVDIIKIDVKGVDPARLPALADALRRDNKKLLAEKVETQEEFSACLELGFEYFQGFYFARPVILSGKKIAPSELAILHLLELVDSDADDHTIELAVKRDALISLNLLRLVNTPAAGVRGKIDTLGQAIEVLGRQQLQRWLQILLYATPGAKVEMNLPLLQMATLRGKMLELMTLRIHPGQHAAADMAFTVGIMSLTEALFSMSMRDILATVDVADEVSSALLDREGEYGDMLNVVEILEKAKSGKALTAALRLLDLTIKDMREIEMAAFEWVNELAQEVH
ncbi:EAL domain-containing protein [Massilia eurypsychrophila]|uniref:EAL domain-containing protein n=1 Tax=Massilia eurypsychrophila TaxID=1485217 RepID=A0A2G8THW7_9BURK|nr:EAL domain-containing protein [Massilia eurypsychrophila]PIL45634.1 EAL domain-containing protein [Massilia eurypsychrophila]